MMYSSYIVQVNIQILYSRKLYDDSEARPTRQGAVAPPDPPWRHH